MISPELSPLDQIRQTEAEVNRQIAAAHEQSKHKVARARREIQDLIRKAVETGRLEGVALGKEIVFKTEEEAQAMLGQAQKKSETHHALGQQHMNTAVRFAVLFVLGDEGERETK